MIHLRNLKSILNFLSFELENEINRNPDKMSERQIEEQFLRFRPDGARYWANELQVKAESFVRFREAVNEIEASKTFSVALHVDKMELGVRGHCES